MFDCASLPPQSVLSRLMMIGSGAFCPSECSPFHLNWEAVSSSLHHDSSVCAPIFMRKKQKRGTGAGEK